MNDDPLLEAAREMVGRWRERRAYADPHGNGPFTPPLDGNNAGKVRKALQGVYPVPAGSTSTVFAGGQSGVAIIPNPIPRHRSMLMRRHLPVRPPAAPVLPAWFHPRRPSALAFRPPPTPVPPGGGRP